MMLDNVTMLQRLSPFWDFNLDPRGRTLLIIALETRQARECLDYVIGQLEVGRDLDLKDIPDVEGRTPLMYAIYRGGATVSRLLALGVDINANDQSGSSALRLAMECALREPDVIGGLVEGGADLGSDLWLRSSIIDAMAWARYHNYGRYHQCKYEHALEVGVALIPPVFSTLGHAQSVCDMVTSTVITLHQAALNRKLIYKLVHKSLCALNKFYCEKQGQDSRVHDTVKLMYSTLMQDFKHFRSLGEDDLCEILRMIVLHALVLSRYLAPHYLDIIKTQAPHFADLGCRLAPRVTEILVSLLPVPPFWEYQAHAVKSERDGSDPGLRLRHLKVRGYLDVLGHLRWPRLEQGARQVVLRNLSPCLCPCDSIQRLPLPPSLKEHMLNHQYHNDSV